MAKKKPSKAAKKSNGAMYTKGSTQDQVTAFDLGDDNFFQHGIAESKASRDLRQATASSTDYITRREGFNRHDIDRQRTEDMLPTGHAGIIKACQGVYRKVGLVRNVIDLMADFASEGLELAHPVKAQEAFYREWAKRVNFQSRVHDFIKLLLRDANVVVRRKLAKIPPTVQRQWSKGEDVERIEKDSNTHDRTIPWGYVFFSPTSLRKVSSGLSQFVGGNELIAINISPTLANAIKNPKNEMDKQAVKKLPEEIVRDVKAGKRFIPLDMDRVYVSHYKKDDWEEWATPFLYAILDDVMFKEKMRTADIAALDGVINVIRVWKLGKSDKEIFPTPTAVNKLISILQNNIGGGALDLVWDDMIDLQVEYPPINEILGQDKYKGVDADIVQGLGIPQALIGAGDTARNAQSSFIQLKTLVERLEYIRALAMQWIENELKIVAKAMGFKRIPTTIFGTMSLRDEAKEKLLMIQLMDRGVISIESVQKAFGHDFVIELERLRSEQKIRNGEIPLIERAGPYYRPESVIEKELGYKGVPTNQPEENTDVPKPPGRPPGQDDTKPRDQRHDPVYSLDEVLRGHVAEKLMQEIDKIIDPKFMSQAGVKTMRQLSSQQRLELEKVKWLLLCSLHGDEETISKEMLDIALDNLKNKSFKRTDAVCQAFYEAFIEKIHRKPNLQERRSLMAAAWARRGG